MVQKKVWPGTTRPIVLDLGCFLIAVTEVWPCDSSGLYEDFLDYGCYRIFLSRPQNQLRSEGDRALHNYSVLPSFRTL